MNGLEKVVALTGFVMFHVFIASFSPARGERNQMVNTKFTKPVNAMLMSSLHQVCETVNLGVGVCNCNFWFNSVIAAILSKC